MSFRSIVWRLFSPRRAPSADYLLSHGPDLNEPIEGVLALEMRGHRIVEKIRWLGPDSFIFVGCEDHPWQRIYLSK